MALFTSEKNIIKISVFMENYLGVIYDGDEKLTHGIMRQFLLEKGYECPKKAVFSRINNEDILRGKIIIVKDKVGKNVGYYNPGASFNRILRDLKQNINPVEMEKIRKEILGEQNCILLNNGEVVLKDEEEEYDVDYKSRNSKYSYTKRKRLVPKRRK